MMEPPDAIATVRRYYQLVDAGDVPALVALFSPDTVYERPGYAPLRGRDELIAFYRDTRIIVDGRHRLRSTVSDGTAVAVHGDFEGLLKDGSRVRLRFADFFELDAEGLFSRRDTFFFEAAV